MLRFRGALSVGFAWVISGCGTIAYYETTPTCAAAPPAATAAPPPEAPALEAPAEAERANEIVVVASEDPSRDWHESLREIIKLPPDRGNDALGSDPDCLADMRTLRSDMSNAIELALAHNDWDRERCLSEKARAVGTLYLDAAGFPFRDQNGRAMHVAFGCYAARMAREAQSCTD